MADSESSGGAGPTPASSDPAQSTPAARKRRPPARKGKAAAASETAVPATIQRHLAKTRIASDLLTKLFKRDGTATAGDETHDVIVEMNSEFPGGGKAAQHELINACRKGGERIFEPLPDDRPPGQVEPFSIALAPGEKVATRKSLLTEGYVFARLSRRTILELVALTPEVDQARPLLVYKIWLDHRIKRCVYMSVRTIKSDAARAAFAAAGKGIVWAVADTGIDETHAHFTTLRTLKDLPAGVRHRDFTAEHASDAASASAALVDEAGHGTHVAGIIAGETKLNPEDMPGGIWIQRDERNTDGTHTTTTLPFKEGIAGLAPHCKLVSLKVLEGTADGQLSNLIAAINYVRRVNDYGRTVRIHGINMSLGYAFEPTWFAAGQSPLCTEVDLLVRAGVVVVVAAGNGGYGTVTTYSGSDEMATHLGTINDPGNSAMAITVGSTHREWPHNYGISYFSGKGPTGDGRMKPDLVAPGERIVSCSIEKAPRKEGAYAAFREDSGTSMAAPHVSGAAAAFMSVRTEFIGRPQQVKDILMGSATDLKRQPEFQGAGLVDVMRALQSV